MKLVVMFSKQASLIVIVATVLFLSGFKGLAQSYDDLNRLEGFKTETYYSHGAKEIAETMARRCDNVSLFYKSLIDYEPTVILLVLSPTDWSKYTYFPVYGMPHYDDTKTLIVAAEDNDFWKSFIPPLDQLPSALAAQISSTYSANNSLTMRGFFDLLAIHELGHAFHIQGGLKMQRSWMGELFSNILLHTYIAEREPELLPALTIFPEMVVSSTNKSDLQFTSLQQLETNYKLIGEQYPNNYGWYQCRWHSAAATIYDEAGLVGFVNLWNLLKTQKDPLEDTEFAALLATKAHQSIADVLLKWDE